MCYICQTNKDEKVYLEPLSFRKLRSSTDMKYYHVYVCYAVVVGIFEPEKAATIDLNGKQVLKNTLNCRQVKNIF